MPPRQIELIDLWWMPSGVYSKSPFIADTTSQFNNYINFHLFFAYFRGRINCALLKLFLAWYASLVLLPCMFMSMFCNDVFLNDICVNCSQTRCDREFGIVQWMETCFSYLQPTHVIFNCEYYLYFVLHSPNRY